MNRTGENGAVPKRSPRFFEEQTYWYYNTREGVNIGPFDCLGDAEQGAGDFIAFVCHANKSMLDTLKQYAHHQAA